MRLSSCVQCLVLVCVVGCVFAVANQYEIIQKQVAGYKDQISQEHENIRVLEAEWAFLTNPARLEKIATGYFKLDAMDGRQLVALNAIPLTASFDVDNASDATPAVAQDADNEPAYVADNAMPAPMPLLPTLSATLVSDSRSAP